MKTCLAAVLIFAPATSAAHTITGVIGPLIAENGELVAVRIPRGLAIQDDLDRWRFVCPSAWGGPEAPRALGLGASILIIGVTSPFEIGRDGVAERRALPGLDAANTIELEAAGHGVLALAAHPLQGRATVAWFEPGSARVVLDSDRPLQSIESDGDGFLAATATTAGLSIARYDLDGAAAGETFAVRASTATSATTIDIERAGGALYAIFGRTLDYRLTRIEGASTQELARSPDSIYGPVAGDGAVYLIANGALVRLAGDQLEEIDRSETFAGIEALDDRAYAGTLRRLYRVEPSGALSLVFDLAELKGPRLAHLGPDERAGCEFEWSILANEAGLDPTLPDEGEVEPEPSCGCASVTAERFGSMGRGMKLALLSTLLLTLACGLASAKELGPPAKLPEVPKGMASATFAGGCFWCMEGPFDETPGVLSTTSGYTGGEKVNPTYDEVSAGKTGHAEAIFVVFDPKKISYARLLEVFWHNIDPLAENRQFCDSGSQYRSAVYYHDDAQKKLAEDTKAEVAKKLGKPVFTQIVTATAFYPAEVGHQDFYKTNSAHYRAYRSGCGRDRRLKELWGEGAGH